MEAYSNTNKTKTVVFRRGGRLLTNLEFKYNGNLIEIVNKFSYLGIVFTSGGSSFDTQKTLSGQALKAMFTMNKYLYNFTALKTSHRLDLFDKLITPILNYGSEVWGFHKSATIERKGCIYNSVKRQWGLNNRRKTILFMVSWGE